MLSGIEPKKLTIVTYQSKNMNGQDCPWKCQRRNPKGYTQAISEKLITTTFLDANLLHDIVTGKSITAVLHFVNTTPTDWLSKRQATVETATYGSDL